MSKKLSNCSFFSKSNLWVFFFAKETSHFVKCTYIRYNISVNNPFNVFLSDNDVIKMTYCAHRKSQKGNQRRIVDKNISFSVPLIFSWSYKLIWTEVRSPLNKFYYSTPTSLQPKKNIFQAFKQFWKHNQLFSFYTIYNLK